MDSSLYQKIFLTSPLGYAYHKVLYDAQGQPCDYLFLEVNPAFEKLTGLKAADIIGCKASEVLPKLRAGHFDWLAFFGDIAQNGGNNQTEQYSEDLQQWFQVRAFSPKNDYFITEFSRIPLAAQAMAEFSEELLQLSTEKIDYQRIADILKAISKAEYVAFNIYDERGETSTTVALAGVKDSYLKVTSLLGYEVLGKQWPYNPEREILLGHNITTTFSSLREVIGAAISKPLVRLLEKAFSCGEVAVVRVFKGFQPLGDFTFFMPAHEKYENGQMIEIYTRQVGMLLARRKTENKLKKGEDNFRRFFESLQDILIIATPKGEIVHTNKAFSDKLGYDPEDVTQMTLLELHPEAYRQEAERIFSAMIQGERDNCPLPLLRKDGYSLPVETRVSFGTWDGQDCIYGFVKDLSIQQAALEKFHKLFENNPSPMALSDMTSGAFAEVNAAFLEALGYERHEVIGRTPTELNLFVSGEAHDHARRELLIKGKIKGKQIKARRKNGQIMTGLFSGKVIDNQVEKLLLTVMVDFTERIQVEAALVESEKRFRQLFEESPVSLWEQDFSQVKKRIDALKQQEKGELRTYFQTHPELVRELADAVRIIDVNKATVKMYGAKTKEEMTKITTTFVGDAYEDFIETLMSIAEDKKEMYLERTHQTLQGTPIDIELHWTLAPGFEQSFERVLISVLDITARKRYEEQLIHLSLHDQLTGLYNRRFFEEEMNRLDTQRNFPLTIMMIDVNGLKLINDAFGHRIGDQLLTQVAKVLKRVCRSDDIIARIGGDEFTILLPQTDALTTEGVAERIKEALAEEAIQGLPLSVSMGWETKKKRSEEIPGIFKRAEDHMYRKKLYEATSIRGQMIDTVINTLYVKSPREEAHSHRVSRICKEIGQAYNLSLDKIKELETSGHLHDIGKITIDDAILNKPGKLNAEEWAEMKRHAERGFSILSTANDFSEIAKYIMAHHERWDGQGYPRGLKGETIPWMARVIAVADAYDAMTRNRPYKEELSEGQVSQEMKANAGKQFDPAIVRVFIEKVLGQNWGDP